MCLVKPPEQLITPCAACRTGRVSAVAMCPKGLGQGRAHRKGRRRPQRPPRQLLEVQRERAHRGEGALQLGEHGAAVDFPDRVETAAEVVARAARSVTVPHSRVSRSRTSGLQGRTSPPWSARLGRRRAAASRALSAPTASTTRRIPCGWRSAAAAELQRIATAGQGSW